MTAFPLIADHIKPCEQGNVKIDHAVPDRWDAFQEARHGRMLRPDRVHTRLLIDGDLIMSDGDNEYRTNVEVVYQARGNVLIAGLGLGYILHPILAKPDVTSVTVVEVNPHVIALVTPTLPQDKLAVVQGDVFTWRPTKGTKFDTIYFDIWGDISTDALEEMAKLHQAFRVFKAPGGWMNSWQRDWLRYRKRQGR